jgi:Arabinose efflux permease
LSIEFFKLVSTCEVLIMKLSDLARINKRIKAGARETFPALYHKNFMYFWVGQCISLIGTWMQNAGQSWLVLKITNNALLLGVLNAAQFLPMLVFSLFAGVIVDRFPKRKVIIIAQIGLMACAFALAALVWTKHTNYIFILILALLLGVFQSVDMPARQSFMVELVGKEDLLNAVALNSSIFNAARVVGPALAGIVMKLAGAGTAFFINGLSFLAVIYGLCKITVDGLSNARLSEKSVLSNVGEGLRYIYKTHILYSVIVLVSLLNIFCLNFNTLVPTFAMYILKLDESGYGLLMAAMGVGALIGAVSLAAKSSRGPSVTIFMAGGAVLSIFSVALGLQTSFWLSAVFIAFAGWGMVTLSTSANSIIQLNSPDEMRGRIMSVYSLVFGGFTPFGSLYAGLAANLYGADKAFIISGLIGLGVVVLSLFMFKGHIYKDHIKG